MGYQSHIVRPLSVYNHTENSYSDVIDAGSSAEVHAILKIAEITEDSRPPDLPPTLESRIGR